MKNLLGKSLRRTATAFALVAGIGSANAQSLTAQQEFEQKTYGVIRNMETYIRLSYNDGIGMAIRRQINRQANADYNAGRETDEIFFNNLINNYMRGSHVQWSWKNRLVAGLCVLDATAVYLQRQEKLLRDNNEPEYANVIKHRKNTLGQYRKDLRDVYGRQSAATCRMAYRLGS